MEEKTIQNNIQPEKKKSLIKKFFKVFLYIILIIIGLNILLYGLFSIPYIQQKAADFAVDKLKSTMQTEVSIDEVRLSLFNNVSLKGIYVEDQSKDTLLYAQKLSASLSPWEFIKSNKLAITGVNLDDFVINVNRKDSISDFNFQFIIDAFAGDGTAKTDTTKSTLKIVIEDIDIKNGRLNYDVLSDSITPGIFNASHISLYNFSANLDLNSIDTDKLDIALNNLAAKEKTGVEINSLKGQLYSDKSQLWVDGLSLMLPNSHLITTTARFNLDSNEFAVATESTEIDPNDLIAFLPNLKFLEHKINLNTSIKGKLPLLDVENLLITYGEDFILNGKAYLASYERYGNSDINVSIDQLKAKPAAISAFAKLGDSTFVAPDILRDLGDIYFKGKVNGQLSKFKLDAEAWSRQGLISIVANGAVDTTFTNFNVNSNIETKNFNLGRLLGTETGLGGLTAHLNLQAKQTDAVPLSAQVKGAIDGLGYKDHTIKYVQLAGFYNSQKMGLAANANWRIGKIAIDADMSQAKTPDINFRVRLDTLSIDPFYKNENWVNPQITVAMNGSLKGLDIDNITGKVVIDSLDFHDDHFSIKPEKFTLEAGKNSENNKFINLTSSYLTANITGLYTFSTIGDEFTNIMHNYLPDVFLETKRIRKNQNNFTFTISAQNTEELAQAFPIPVDIIQPAVVNGQVNTIDQKINVKGNIPYLRYGNIDIKNTTIDIANLDSAFNIAARTGVFIDNGNHGIVLNIDGADDAVHALLTINSTNTSVNIDGKVEASAQFDRDENKNLITSLDVIPTDINVGKLALGLLPASIINKEEKTVVENFGISLNKKRYFGMDGIISDQKTDTLKAYFDHAHVGELLTAFDVENIDACIHGDILLTQVAKIPEVYTDGFEIADILIFGDTLGTMTIESQWSDEYGGIRMDAILNKGGTMLAELDGTAYTKQDSLDLQLRMLEMPVGWIQPFMAETLNKMDGTVSTNLLIEGSTKAPEVRGFIGFNDTQIGIDYTNVVYTISDTIRVSPDKIGFDNLTIKDSRGSTASVNASVTHKNFEDMHYSLNMRMNNLMVLNTEHRTDSLFYGRVFASGNVRIDGNDNGINMNMQIKNDKNSVLNILIPQRSEASNYQSVVYINVPEEKLKNTLDNLVRGQNVTLPMKLNIKLDVTPDIALGVVIDPSTGDKMSAKGNGSINFSYDLENDNMSAYGDFTVTEGSVRLNLQSIKKLDFKIRDGSKLYFTGDPMKTRFDITAYRRVRANLQSLDASFGSDGGNPKVQVDCVLGIKGNMDQMSLTYDIELPEANDDVQRRVNSLISTDEQKITQFAYLVATGSFYTTSTGVGSGGNFGDGLWTSIASSTLSSGLNALFGNILGNGWEVGTNIESNDGTLSDVDMSVNVSRRFLDDKLRINTNVGYRTDQSDDSFIGDFDVEYQLNALWTLRAYTHTNDKFYKQAPTTQGIGIVYTKEAATLKRLFQSFKPRRRRSLQNTTGQPSDSTQVNIQKQPIINDEKSTPSTTRE
ncbi:MAG: translocation/assembly module TamB domain-containing protein [Dysgonomonas sp.]|nr:translocation/assembly module TamB domain-containing protein [Dysgonomonas sp.]